MSKRRVYADNRSYHITHRCHNRSFFLKFRQDRDNFVRRLWEAKNRYPVDLYNYIVTCNHVHLLLSAPDGSAIPEFMRYLSGLTAQDHNLRKNRRGAFWDGPFRPTLIQDGRHLARCLFYIDMNMVRAGVVDSPRRWRWSGFHELSGGRRRYRLLNRGKLASKLFIGSEDRFVKWYKATLAERLQGPKIGREAFWSESNCVGDEDFVFSLAGNLEKRRIREIEPGLYFF